MLVGDYHGGGVGFGEIQDDDLEHFFGTALEDKTLLGFEIAYDSQLAFFDTRLFFNFAKRRVKTTLVEFQLPLGKVPIIAAVIE